MPEQAMAGPAFTILGKVDPTADAHETLLEWTGLLSKCPAGHIWVNQPNDNTVAHMGELSCLLYTSPSPRDKRQSRMPSSA